jgi:hypothetical protein
MAETKTQVAVPTAAQYEALVAPPPERFASNHLFDYQLRRYAEAGVARVEDLEPLRALVPEDGKLFLVVPQKPQIATKADLDALVAKLDYRRRRGVNYLDPQYLADEVAVPNGPYLMTNVEDGRAMLNIAPRDARPRLADENRSPLLWFEGFGLYLTFGFALLGHHNVDCSGSRYESELVPNFFLDDGQPKLSYYWDGSAGPHWGSASCGSRRGLRT